MRPLFTPNFQGGFRVLKHKSHDRLPQSLVKTYNSLTSNCCQIFRLRTKSQIGQNPELDKISKYKIPQQKKSRIGQNPEWSKSRTGKNRKVTKNAIFFSKKSNYLTGS